MLYHRKNSLFLRLICKPHMLRSIPVLFLLCFSASLFAQDNTPKYSNEFLSIGVSAKALGLSQSVVAGTDDATAGYWNPAGLLRIEPDLQIAIMHSEYFAGIAKYDYGSIAHPLKDSVSAIAFSLIRFGVDDIPNTLYLIEPDGSINYDNIISFSVADYAFIGSYARRLKWNGLQVGGNVKIVHRIAGEFATSWGFGLDAGAQLQKNNWQFGAMARDITSTFNAWSFNFTDQEKDVLISTGNTVPDNSLEITTPKLILGASYLFHAGENFGLRPELDADFTTDGRRNVLVSADPLSIDPHAGLEVNYKNFIYLRGGVGNIQRIIPDDKFTESWAVQPNIGLGLVIGPIKLDYAYTNIGKQSEVLYSNVFSLLFDVNKEKPK